MGDRPPTACKTAYCGGHSIPNARGYCAACLKANPSAHVNRESYNNRVRRPGKHLYYKSRWRYQLQPAILRRDPICKLCNHNPSTIGDHITDHKGNETLFWSSTNLQGVCEDCHAIKTAASMAARRQ